MKKGGNGVVLTVVVVAMVVLSLSGADAGAEERNLKEECSNDFEKLVSCFEYATGKAVGPSKECCDSIEGIKERKAECLCFFIQETHNGNQQIKSLGIEEIKLLQLPFVCHLKNSSVTYCPKLLGLPANSPDAAIFNNATSRATTATTTTRTTPDGSSSAKMVANSPARLVAAAFVVVLFSTFLQPIVRNG